MSIQIEKGVPLPEVARGSNIKYPFADMEIGDSFAVPISKYKNKNATQASLHSCFKRYPQFQFTTRTEGETIRVWRIA